MNPTLLKITSEYLTEGKFKHTVSDDVILIDRDSICNNTWIRNKKLDEENGYKTLLEQLIANFNERFYYASKSDDWLMLNVIPKKD